MECYLPMFLRHQNAITTEIDDGLDILLEEGLKRIRLNGTAKKVWELTITPISLDEIVKHIMNTYGQSSSSVREEILQFLDNATRHGLISQFISRLEVCD